MTSSKEYPVPKKLWEHPDPRSTALYRFMKEAEIGTGQSFPVYFLVTKFILRANGIAGLRFSSQVVIQSPL